MRIIASMNIEFTEKEVKILRALIDNSFRTICDLSDINRKTLGGEDLENMQDAVWDIMKKLVNAEIAARTDNND